MTKRKFRRNKSNVQVANEIFFDFRPCCVKIKRAREMPNDSEDQPSRRTLRSSFRNPALALTKRRAEELRSQKTMAERPECSPPQTSKVQEQESSAVTKPKDQELRTQESKDSTVQEPEDSAVTKPKAQKLKSKQESKEPTLTKRSDRKLRSGKPESEDAQGSNQPIKSSSTTILERRPNTKEANKSYLNKDHQKENNNDIFEKDDIYEFLSQSQSSGSDTNSNKHKDPAADIIKRLIEEGKVNVTKNYKGKPVVVHKKINRKTNNKKTNKLKCQALAKNKTIQFKKQLKPIHDVIHEADEIFDDLAQNVVKNADFILPMPPPNETILNMSNIASTSKNQTSFSNLARSVLMQQTNQINSLRRNVSDISTPLRRAPAPMQRVDINLSPIPKAATPNKKKTLTNTSFEFENDVSFAPSLPNEISNNNLHPNRASQYPTTQQNSLSSFSSNDSNAENMPPIRGLSMPASNIENSNRQTLNARRTLPNRQPLKPLINIIDVIELPPYEHAVQKTTEDSKLFGFEEYLEEDQNELNESGNIINNNNAKNSTIRNLRKRLKKLRPMVQRPSQTKRSTITKNIFDDFGTKIGQRDIRNMLCSTMCEKPRSATITSTVDNDSSDSSDCLPSTSRKNDAVDLFGDPESTFDQQSLHRTYERPFKRKRKLQHQYSVFLDSEDESEHESEGEIRTTTNKRKNREKSADKELKEFVSQFNSMIKEAEDYELIVE